MGYLPEIQVVMVICVMLFRSASGGCDTGMHEIEGSCYSHQAVMKTAYEAETECPLIPAANPPVNPGQHLAAFASQSELDAVYNFYSSLSGVTSALAVRATNASIGLPSDGNGCVVIGYGSVLRNEDCALQHTFLCERDMDISTTVVTETITTNQQSTPTSTSVIPITTTVATASTEPSTTTRQYTTKSSTTSSTSSTMTSTATTPRNRMSSFVLTGAGRSISNVVLIGTVGATRTPLRCAVKCASADGCHVFSHSAANQKCYLGDAGSMDYLEDDSECNTYEMFWRIS
ncbi:uncharacterized protein LOC121430390 [Lytechinus variegatus]|uniref:uncharacterized protein LOC121430390 n=1 Tax=Lytechinus variegatus TaxID=7654 RepID=UPI001BB10B07|nr:uncharacterized protein LOC121430390 [Lytechinus variegatus]